MFECFWPKEIIPDALRDPFEKTFIEPLKQKRRDEQTRRAACISKEIEDIEQQLSEVVIREQAAKAKRIEIERALAAVQSDLATAKADEESFHWQAFELRGKIQTLTDDKIRTEQEIEMMT